jgi:hypothetical protein
MQGLNTFAFLICRGNCLLTTKYYLVESNKYLLVSYKVSIFLINSHIFATYLYTNYDLAFFRKRLVNCEFTINVYFGFR